MSCKRGAQKSAVEMAEPLGPGFDKPKPLKNWMSCSQSDEKSEFYELVQCWYIVFVFIIITILHYEKETSQDIRTAL